MKQAGEKLLLMFDWFVPFYEKALPKKPPKIPTLVAMAHAAEMAYDYDPVAVPTCFMDGWAYRGISKRERREIAIRKIARDCIKHAPKIERYMLEEYDVLVVFQDGDYTSKGKRIVTNSERAENVEAARFQASWDNSHCDGTHAREDFMAEQINRLQPKALVERHRLVIIPLPKPKGGK